jgi:hypothetical protein
MEWQALLLLGAFHGINPGMGWLFAVALGMQHQSARGVWRALPAIASGHALAVGAVVLVATAAGLLVPGFVLKAITAAVLMTIGGYRLWRHRHPRFGGMQVGFRDLTAWSFLMASSHGAGVMLLPWVLITPPDATAAAGDHASHAVATGTGTPWVGVLAVSVHTLAYLAVMTLVAWLVYRRLGLAFLRTAWFNLDWVWAGALIVTGLAVLVVW